MDRKNKIALLTGIMLGTRTIKELIPDTFQIVLDCDDGSGAVYDVDTGKRYSADQVQSWRQKSIQGSQLFIEL